MSFSRHGQRQLHEYDCKKIESSLALGDVYSAAFASHINYLDSSGCCVAETFRAALIDVPVEAKIILAAVIIRKVNLPPTQVQTSPDGLVHEKWPILTALAASGIWRNVVFPSRLHASSSREKPLAGARTTCERQFRLAGVKITITNRGFLKLYPADSETAAYVSLLMELGAVLVDKTRIRSFAAGEEPTDQWIDFHCPFCPQ